MKNELQKLNSALVKLLSASEALGGIDGSYGWNAAESKVMAAQKEYDAALKNLIDSLKPAA